MMTHDASAARRIPDSDISVPSQALQERFLAAAAGVRPPPHDRIVQPKRFTGASSTSTSDNPRLAPLQGDVHAMRHLSIPEQGRYLRLVLNGFFNYCSVSTNSGAFNAFF